MEGQPLLAGGRRGAQPHGARHLRRGQGGRGAAPLREEPVEARLVSERGKSVSESASESASQRVSESASD